MDDVVEFPAGAVAQICALPITDPRLSWTMNAHETAAVIRRIAVPRATLVMNMGFSISAFRSEKTVKCRVAAVRVGGGPP